MFSGVLILSSWGLDHQAGTFLAMDNYRHDTCKWEEYGINIVNKKNTSLTMKTLGILKMKSPSFSNYVSLEARLASYRMWPTDSKVMPKILSEAGFFYTGWGDQTICFHCGGGLNRWEESDEPWVEHARWFKKCTFLLLVKGKAFVDEVCCKKTSQRELEEVSNKYKLEHSLKSLNISNQQEEGCSDMDHSIKCKICFTEEVSIAFLPCGHTVACVMCALSLTTCAVCRQTIAATVRVYLS